MSARVPDGGHGHEADKTDRSRGTGKTSRILIFVGAAALAVGLAGGCAASSGGSTPENPTGGATRTIHVIEHADTDKTIDIGKKGDSTGDILTFHNKVFDKQDKKVVGTDLGRCIRIEAGRSYECDWTTSLHGGQIAVNGPFYDDHDSVLAITGGTGAYKRARGEMLLRSRKGGSEFDFVFKLAG